MRKIIASVFAIGLLASAGGAGAAEVHIGVGIRAPVHHGVRHHRVRVCSVHYVHHHRVRSCHWAYR